MTGGSGGIGQAICTELGLAGAAVAVGYFRNASGAEELAASLAAVTRALPVQVDVTDEASVDHALGQTCGNLGRVNILINNAGGMSQRHAVSGMDLSLWDETLALNLTSVFLCTKAALPQLLQAGDASIVNIASSAIANGGSGGSVHYAAAKSGLIGWTRGLALELASAGVRVNAVAPAAIPTEFHQRVPPVKPIDRWTEDIPLGRTGLPTDVAEAVRFLVSPESGFITGQVLHVNGGVVLG